MRELRARRGLSQEELGFRCRLHRNYVGVIERGEINPTLRVMLKLCRGLGVPMRELVVLYERQLAARPQSERFAACLERPHPTRISYTPPDL